MQYRPLNHEDMHHSTLLDTVTHGLHSFCMNDITATHLVWFLTICTCVLGGRAWSLTRGTPPTAKQQ
jgi:hypothetical protein